jgi:hypothetical protein
VEVDNKLILHRILNGYYYINFNNKTYKIVSPSNNIKFKAHKIYLDILEDIRFDDNDAWLPEDKRLFLLNLLNIWDKNKEDKLQELSKGLNNIKLSIYKNFYFIDVRKKLYEAINETYAEINKLHSIKYTFFDQTKESFASLIKNRYLTKHMVYINNKKFFKRKIINNEYYLLNLFMEAIDREALSAKDVKNFVLSEEWRGYWECNKGKVFGKSTQYLNDDQRLVINISRMYDSIRKHPECPNEDIIRDYEALEGWILYQNEKNEKEKKKQQLESKIKDKNAGEIFVMTSDPQETKEVLSLNDPVQLAKMRKIRETAQQSEHNIKWQDIPIVKQDLINELRERNKK